jgi:hypothetical protein
MNSKRKALFISILSALLLTVCIGTWSYLKWSRRQSPPRSNLSDKLASSKGWEIYQSNGNKKIYQASIESFSVERAKLGPFAIGPLYVGHVKKALIDLYAEGFLSDAEGDEHQSKLETFRIEKVEDLLADIKNNLFSRSKKVRILDINGISLSLWEGEKRVFQISGDRGAIDRQTGDIIFTGHACLDAAENGSIISHRIRWVRKTSLFRIMDPFILTKGNEKKEGRELETDHLLKKISYRVSK